MEISEKVAYLKGLAEGLALDTESKEGKLIAAIIDVLDDMAEKFAEVDDELCDVEDGLDAVSDDLSDVEETLYFALDDDEDDDEGDEEEECCDHLPRVRGGGLLRRDCSGGRRGRLPTSMTMGNGYFEAGCKERITYFDVFFRKVPDGGGFAIAAGLEQLIDYIENLHFTQEDIAYLRGRNLFCEEFLDYLRTFRFTGDIYAVPEGVRPCFPRSRWWWSAHRPSRPS